MMSDFLNGIHTAFAYGTNVGVLNHPSLVFCLFQFDLEAFDSCDDDLVPFSGDSYSPPA
jgi:hypothetical protein